MAAAAVNYPDVLIIANRYQISVPTPFVPGSEFAGVVRLVGDGVTDWRPGDRVFGTTMHGAFAEQIAVSARAIRRVPDGASLEAAAGFWVAHLTAYHSLRSVAQVQPGDKVLVLGAAGGVGLAAVELAALMGAEVIAAASSADKLAVCRARGAAHTIDYVAEDLRARLKEIAPRGVDVVLDPVGGPYSEPALRSTGFGGRFVVIGFAAGEIPKIPLNLVLLKGVIITALEMRGFVTHRAEDAARNEAELMELLASGRITPHVSSRHRLEDTTAALHEVAGRRAVGKVLIVP